MTKTLLGLAGAAFDEPEVTIKEILKHAVGSVQGSRGVFLACDGSDQHPRYRKIAAEAESGEHTAFLGRSLHVSCLLPRCGLQSKLLERQQVADMGPDWLKFFERGCLMIPVPGRPFGYSEKADHVGGVILIGSVPSSPMPDNGTRAAIASVASVCLHEAERSKAEDLHRRLPVDKLIQTSGISAETLGASLLELIRAVVPFYAGAVYLRDPERNPDYMIVASTYKENRKKLFRSYWSEAAFGLTHEAMRDKRPFSGGPDDLPDTAKRTNDEAVDHVPGPLHAAWALVPFVARNRGVAVAHIEGVHDVDGLRRHEWETLLALGRSAGELVHDWRESTLGQPDLRADVTLVESMHDLFIQRDKAESKRLFQELIRRMIGTHSSFEDVTSTVTARVDGMFKDRSGRTFVTEVCLPDKAGGRSLLEKARQLMDYLGQTSAHLGILFYTGDCKFKPDPRRGDRRVIVLDEQRIKRFCCLSRDSWTKIISDWLERCPPGIHKAWFEELHAP